MLKLRKPASATKGEGSEAGAEAGAEAGVESGANPNEGMRAWNVGKTKIATSFSVKHAPDEAATEAYKALLAKLGGEKPGVIICHLTAPYDGVVVSKTLLAISGGTVPIAGGTSCGGVFTDEGFHSDEGYGLALWACSDPEGHFGVGICDKEDDAEAAAANAAADSILSFSEDENEPDLVWLIGR